VVLAERPAKAEPLLFAAEVNAYNTSENPCSPLFNMPCKPSGYINSKGLCLLLIKNLEKIILQIKKHKY
jgi:hypothetical protein